MSNQQVVAPRISTNGFGPRRAERDNSNKPLSSKPTGIMNGGRLTNASPSRDRIMYVMMYLIGQRVDVHVKNGSVISGILHTANDKDFGIVLKMAQVTKDGSVKGQKSLSDIVKKPETMIIPSRELVQIIAKDVGLTSDELASNSQANEKKKDLMIDSVISNKSYAEERELEKWAPDADDLDCLESLELPSFNRKWGRKWDQFETNEALFGVKSTFNEDIYTTKLVKGPHMRELELQASRIAREIEGEDTDDLHLAEERGMEFLNELEIDEELRYSAVPRETDSWRSNNNSFTDSWRSRPAEADSWRKPVETDSWRRPSTDSWRSHETLQSQFSVDTNSSNNNGEGYVDLSTSTSVDVDPVGQVGTGGVSNESVENKAKSVDLGFRLEEDEMKEEEEEFVLQPQPDIKPSEEDNKLPAPEDKAQAKKEQETKEAEKSSSETVNNNNNKVGPTTDKSLVKVNSPGQSQSKLSSSASSAAGLSRTSSMASDKSSLNPNAKEFKLNPHARSFQPNFRPATPPPAQPVQPPAVQVIPDQSFYYPPNLSPQMPPPHNMPPQMPIPMMGGGFGQQQFMYNPQAGVPMQQAFVQPNPPPYGQQMMMGQPQPRAMYYMPGFAPPEMQYRGRNY